MDKEEKNKNKQNSDKNINEIEQRGNSKNQTGYIPEFFDWISVEKQKEKVEQLENITKNKNQDS